MNSKKGNSVSQFLSPELLARIDNYHIVAKLAVEGLMSGMHRSVYHGFGTEFLQYRNYSHGDDFKTIDWKTFGRLDRLYSKVFREETNFDCSIILDSSASMGYQGRKSPCSKLKYAAMLAASIAYVATKQGDNVGLFIYSDKIKTMLKHGSRQGHLARFIDALSAADASGTADHISCLDIVGRALRRRGIIVFISDFLDTGATPTEIFKKLRITRNDCIVIQTLDCDETNFDFSGAVRFIDSESDARILTAPQSVRGSYLERLAAHLEETRLAARKIESDYILVNSSDNLGVALSKYLHSRGAVYS